MFGQTIVIDNRAGAGGQVGTPEVHPWGATLDATDAQGTDFAVFQPVPGIPRPELNGAGPGELSYLTYQVRDSAAFKAFYGAVLGWTIDVEKMPQGDYILGAAGGTQVVGLMHIPPNAAAGGARPAWTGYVAVTDVDAKAAEAAAS